MRRIELRKTEEGSDFVRFVIQEQTERGYMFTPDGNTFRASNGWKIESVSMPEVQYNCFFVRGNSRDYDDQQVEVSNTAFRQLSAAVAEYNKTFGGRVCCVCGCAVRAERTFEGHPICSKCHKLPLTNCAYCGQVAVVGSLETVTDPEGNECEACQSCIDGFVDCAECEERYHESHMTGRGNMYICSKCWERYNYGRCDHCGRVLRGDDIQYLDGSDLCESCYDEAITENVIHQYGFIPSYVFRSERGGRVVESGTNTPAQLFLGVELEVDNGDRGVVDRLSGYDGDRVYFKSDGSLSDNGFEAVSHPTTLPVHLKGFGWPGLINTLKDYGYTSHKAGNCGIHVHVNNSYLGKTQRGIDLAQFKLLAIFSRFWDQLERISRRHDLEYCHQNGEPMNMYELQEEKDRGRYYALNFSNFATTEFRLWRGSLNLNTFCASLEITARLCEFVKTHNIIETRNISWSGLRNFINSGSHFTKKYMNKRGV